jgi:uncharacterized RDD family membrane protein YckC
MSVRASARADGDYVGFWARFAASLIDLVGVMFVVVPATVFLFGNGWAYAQGAAAFLVNWCVPGAVYIAFWVLRGATPGKMAIKAVVVDAETCATPDFWQALTRYVGFFVSITPLFLGFAWVAFDARKQAWHDKMARTVVIYRRR